MTTYRLVNTDNFGGDYPNEKWETSVIFRDIQTAREVQKLLNEEMGENHPRFIQVVELPYELAPGFEP